MTPKEFIKSKQNDVLLNEYTLQEMEWFMAEFAKQEVSEQLLIQRVVMPKGTLCDLDGKEVMVKFKVTKHIPKIFIEDI